jgi:hypothetical protein
MLCKIVHSHTPRLLREPPRAEMRQVRVTRAERDYAAIKRFAYRATRVRICDRQGTTRRADVAEVCSARNSATRRVGTERQKRRPRTCPARKNTIARNGSELRNSDECAELAVNDRGDGIEVSSDVNRSAATVWPAGERCSSCEPDRQFRSPLRWQPLSLARWSFDYCASARSHVETSDWSRKIIFPH